MDLLYTRYSNPLDLMNRYINQGRFGQFVSGFLEAEYDRKKEEADKDLDWKLWVMYVHAMPDKSFGEWKQDVLKSTDNKQRKASKDHDLDDDGINAIVNKLFPS